MMKWFWKRFEAMTVDELYSVLQLREAVFQIEQKCFYEDCDGVDKSAEHLLGYEEDVLTAYLRIYKKNKSVHIGRIVLAKSARGKGLGREMMQLCLSYIKKHYPDMKVEMLAQAHLEAFYNGIGFESVGEPYDDAGILHIRMILKD